jgi:hypothetical protein
MIAWRNRFGSEPDDLPVSAHGAARFDGAQSNFVSGRNVVAND